MAWFPDPAGSNALVPAFVPYIACDGGGWVFPSHSLLATWRACCLTFAILDGVEKKLVSAEVVSLLTLIVFDPCVIFATSTPVSSVVLYLLTVI